MNTNNKFKTKIVAMLIALFMVLSFCYSTGLPLYNNVPIVSVASAASISPVGQVTAQATIYKGNNTSSKALVTLSKNAYVVIFSTSGSFYRVACVDSKNQNAVKIGYVQANIVQRPSNVTYVLKGKVICTSLYVRVAPDKSSKSINIYKKNTVVDVIGEQMASNGKYWYNIKYGSPDNAWISANTAYSELSSLSFKVTQVTTTTTAKPTTTTTTTKATTTTKPTTTTTTKATTTTKPTTTTTKSTTTTTKPTTTTTQTTTTTTKPIIIVTSSTNTANTQKGIVNQNSVSLKESMSSSSKTITVLKKNTSVVILDHIGSWYRIKCGNKTGYVPTKYIKETTTTTIAKPTTTTTKSTIRTTTTTKPTTTTTTAKPTTTTKETITTKSTTTTKKTTTTTKTTTTKKSGATAVKTSVAPITYATSTTTAKATTTTKVTTTTKKTTTKVATTTKATTTTTKKATTTTTKATQAQKTDYSISVSAELIFSSRNSNSFLNKWYNSDVVAQGSLFGTTYVLVANSYGGMGLKCSNSAYSGKINVTSNNASVSVVEVQNNSDHTGVILKASSTGKATITASIPNNTKTFSFTVAVVTEDQVISTYEKEAMRIINQYRTDAGVSKLIEASDLKATAETRANECRQKFEKAFAEGQTEFTNTFAHTRLDGSPYARAFPATYLTGGWLVNENVAIGYEVPVSLCRGWYNSSGHRTTMLSTNYDRGHVGLSISDNGRFYWVLNVAGPSNATL